MVSPKINFNTKHLGKGDPLPPWSGKLRVYNMRLCPFAQRTILTLNAKQIDYEVINIDLVNKPEWLPTKSIFGKVPTIEVEDGVCICESLIIAEYLEEVYPEIPLISKDPIKKAYEKIIIEASEPIFVMYFKVMRAPDTINDETLMSYHKALTFFEEQLRNRGTRFLGGEKPGFADYMIWPWFERIQSMNDEKLKIKSAKFDLLVAYIENMYKDPAVSQYLLPKDVMDKFHAEYKTGKFEVQSIEDLL